MNAASKGGAVLWLLVSRAHAFADLQIRTRGHLHRASPFAQVQEAPARTEAQEGGRPATATRINDGEFAKLVHGAAFRDEPARVWLELVNGENLVVSFETTVDDVANTTCTMRVRQSRLEDQCSPTFPEACRAEACVAVRWNLRHRRGMLLDLFKARKGCRTNCDLSNTQDRSVRWGELLLRVTDDIAALLGCRHVFLADEASVQLNVWDPKKGAPSSHQVMLKYLRPLVEGVAYYDRFGYYTIDRKEWPIETRKDCAAEAAGACDERVHAAQAKAMAHINSFNAVRTAPFAGGLFADALASIEHAKGERTPPTEETLIWRFGSAVATAQVQAAAAGAAEEAVVEAFRAAIARQEEDEDAPELPHRFGVHARNAVPSDRRLAEFCEHHAAALDADILSCAHLGEMMKVLFERNKSGERRGLEAGSLLLALMFDFFALWAPRRFMPLKRKDYYEGGGLMSAMLCGKERLGTCMPPAHSSEPFSMGLERRTPLVSEVFFLCAAGLEDDLCELPWDDDHDE